MKKIVAFFFVLVLFIGGSPAMAQTPDRATWLWNPWMFYDSPESTLVFLQQKKVSTVFVQIDSDIPRTKYHAFLTGAHKANIKVFALDGAPNWGNTTGAKAKNKFKNWLANYQKTAPATAKFDGIHVDIEPYGLPEWETKRAATVRGFQNVLTELAAFSKTQKLQFEADIPFWFDEITYNNPTYGKGNLAEWTIKNTDGVALMSYRDTAQAIIDISSKEMDEGWHFFVSVSKQEDRLRAPEGYQTVTISTHTNLEYWKTKESYDAYREIMKNRILDAVEQYYPGFQHAIDVIEDGAPRGWENYTLRTNGYVGGIVLIFFGSCSH